MEQSKNKIVVGSDGMTCHLIFVDVHQTEIFLFSLCVLICLTLVGFSFHSRMRTWNVRFLFYFVCGGNRLEIVIKLAF